MSRYQPLHCDLHDYLEIACMQGYRLWVECLDGSGFQALAKTTRTSSAQEEFLCLETDNGPIEVRLDRLLAITPLNEGSRFGRVQLAAPAGPA